MIGAPASESTEEVHISYMKSLTKEALQKKQLLQAVSALRKAFLTLGPLRASEKVDIM